ncbi:hypothetical protein A0J61_00678 [Choanephora cucurbitarum]|uniref:Uncharacterized protein n=1 Tax=Choanephora cucurbitarum TaxID=101091 RepID=A0A1C7NQH2_9FUNG|nr:hypothetical protein A0J61_00678 [Choanephora cucurbitarum]
MVKNKILTEKSTIFVINVKKMFCYEYLKEHNSSSHKDAATYRWSSQGPVPERLYFKQRYL